MLCCFHYVLPKDNQSLCLIIKYFLKYFPVQSSAEFVTSRRLQQDLSGPTLTESQSDWARLSSVVRLSAAWKQIRNIFLLLIKYFQWCSKIFMMMKYFQSGSKIFLQLQIKILMKYFLSILPAGMKWRRQQIRAIFTTEKGEDDAIRRHPPPHLVCTLLIYRGSRWESYISLRFQTFRMNDTERETEELDNLTPITGSLNLHQKN